jgi:hypothetical protein
MAISVLAVHFPFYPLFLHDIKYEYHQRLPCPFRPVPLPTLPDAFTTPSLTYTKQLAA